MNFKKIFFPRVNKIQIWKGFGLNLYEMDMTILK